MEPGSKNQSTGADGGRVAGLAARVTRILDYLESKLIAGQRKAPRSAAPVRQEPKASAQATMFAKTLLVFVFSVSLLTVFLFGVIFYSTTERRIESDPLVTNLNALGVKTLVAFGDSACVRAGDIPCEAAPDLDDTAWAAVDVPRVPLPQVPGFEAGRKTGTVWYRFHLPVTEAQLAAKVPLAFTPVYVLHHTFRIWVNGRLVDSASTEESGSTVVTIALPPEDIRDGRVLVTIKGSVGGGDNGIVHLLPMYVGPRVVLDRVHVLRERSLFSYFLLFLATKGSIFVVFSLFFLFSKDRRALFHFLVYAFFVTSENLLAGDFLAGLIDLNTRFACFYLGKVVAIIALGSFLGEYVQAYRARSVLKTWHLTMLVGVGLMLLDLTAGTKTVTGMWLFNATNIFLVLELSLGLVLGLLAIRQWSRAAVDPRRVTMLRLFVGAVAVYQVLLVWEFTGNSFLGFDKRAVFDLLFFYYMAFVTAKEFGFNQGHVITLEAHMAEKRRMEQELQEAAEIAKAFVPGEAPSWAFADVAVFHRPLTETSGDWYTFESGPSGRWSHVLMCDITGHGVQAALVVSTCRTTLSALLNEHPQAADSPGFISHYAESLNKILYMQGGGHHVTTLLGLSLDSHTGEIHFLAAGHPLPLMFPRPSEDSGTRQVKALVSRAAPLGVAADGEWPLARAEMKSGDELLVYTDGLPAQTTLKVLRRFVASRPLDAPLAPQALYEALWAAELERSKGSNPDDVSVIWIRWQSAAAAPAGTESQAPADPLKDRTGAAS